MSKNVFSRQRAAGRWGWCLALGWALAGNPAWAQPTQFPEGMGGRLEVQPWWSYESNPFRFSEAQAAQGQSDTMLGALARGALAVPLLSERTRLDLSGAVGHVRYQHYRQLNHDPARFDGVLRWHVGHGLSGTVRHRYSRGLYRYLNRSYPDRDQVRQRLWEAAVNLHVTPSWTLPRLAVGRQSTGYDFEQTAMLYGRNVDYFEAATTWRGVANSALSVGWRQDRGHYTERTPYWQGLIGSRYTDRTPFFDVQWDYSVKTTLAARVSYPMRQYDDVAERDVKQWAVLLRAGWSPSPKSRWDVSLWRQPWANDEDPTILYGTLTGGRLSWRWHPTVKTMFSLAVAYEHQDDTAIAGFDDRKSRLLRLGPRFEWQPVRSLRLFVDAWHDRTRGSYDGNSFRNNVVRVGLVFSLDNHWKPPHGMMWFQECDPPRYIEAWACQSE